MSKITSNSFKIQTKVFVSKIKGNESVITPISSIKEAANLVDNNYFTINAKIEEIKYTLYKVFITIVKFN